MSEVVNEAVIKVTADATGVETGMRKVGAAVSEVGSSLQAVDAAATKTGKTIESLGQRPGLRNVGDGADVAAMRIDKSTKNMADAIQRATAAMDSGTKGSAAYFAALANSRGLNMTALAPYLAQLDAVTQKTAAAAAAQRQLEAGSRFLDGLRSQAEGIGKTASQLAALRAEQLGVADAARPLIEQLQAAEEAAGGAEESTGGFSAAVAAIGLGGGIASIAQLADEYGKYVSQLELATEGQTEFTNAQSAVKRIATTAQSDLSATGSLYANITKSTRELGLAQSQVADITETVSLGLKVSNASSEAAASAILQLSQAFASGMLRGDEFNSVNEAAPRLMQALADGIGVPTGALRKMAEEGELTTAVLAQALPRALETLRTEAESVQTIGGAMTVLKNEILEMVGATAQSSGVVATLSGGIKLLSDNLSLAAGAATTMVAAKIGASLGRAAKEAYDNVAANRALAVSNLATARSNVAATAAASAVATARVNELRASVMAAEGNVALAIATNGLIPAQARAAVAAEAHTAALVAQTAAARAASVAAGLARGALSLLGGPVGAVITLLGIGATAWAVWGDSARKAEQEAAGSVKASTEEVLESLEKQIAKLRERNRLASIGFKPAEVSSPGGERLAEVVGQIDRAGRGIGEYANLNLEARTEILKVLGKQYGDLTAKIAEFNRESDIDAGFKSAKTAAQWMEKYATNTEKLNAELDKAKKDLGAAFTPKLEARIREHFEGRNSASKKNEEQMKREAAMAAELSGLSASFADDWKLLSTMYAKGGLSLEQLTAAQEKLLKNQPGMKEAAEQEAEDRKKSLEAAEQYSKAYEVASQGAATAVKTLQAQRDENEQIGLGARALAELNAQRLEDLALRAEAKIWAAEGLDFTGQMAERYREEAQALRERAQAMREGAVKRETDDVGKKALQELNQFLDPSRAQTFGEALREAFGTAGESLSRLTATLDGFGKRQAEIAKQRANAESLRGTKDFDELKYLQAVGELNKRQTQDQLASYGSMANAAAGFFGEQSKGYEALMTVSKVFHAAELAMTLAELVPKGIAAVLNQGTGDPYSAFGRMAAMAAIVGGLGVAIGGVSGGGGVPLSQRRQEKQGTGTVLGSDAKSASITRSLEQIERASFQGLGISNGMLSSLRNIEGNIGSFASFLVQTTGVTGDFGKDMNKNVFDSKAIGIGGAVGGGVLGAAGGAYVGMGSSQLGLLLGGPVGMVLGAALGALIGKTFIGKALTSVFGGKQTVQDTGFTLDKASYADILGRGINAKQYADIKTDGGWFRSDKYSTKTADLGEEGERQITAVLKSMYETVFKAGTMVGLGADEFTSQLNGFVVDIGKISLKGLSDDEIQKELEAIFSKIGDDLAKFGVGGLQAFQKVGEGYLETLTRVATNYQAVTVITDAMGLSFDAVGLSSVGARERLIDLVGGLDQFTSVADSFMSDFYTDKERADALRARIEPTLDKFGIRTGADDSLDQFRDVVKSLKLETADGAAGFAELMQIMPAFKQIADVDAKAFEEAVELAKEKRLLEIEIIGLSGDAAGQLAAQRALELSELDSSARSLKERIYALEDEKEALELSKSALSLQAQIYELTGDKAGAAAVLAQQHALALADLDPALRGATQQVWALEAAAKAAEKIKSDASSLLAGVDSAFAVLDRIVKREKSLVDERIAAEKKIVDKHQELSKALRSTLDGMVEPSQELFNRQNAQAQIQAALAIAKAGGSLPDAESLKRALSVVGQDASALYATQQEYLRDFYTTRGDIASLADLTDSTLSVEEKSLKALEAEGKRLDSILENAQRQIDVLKGIDASALSIDQGIAALAQSIAAAVKNPVVGGTDAISGAYQSALGRAPDADGLKFYQDQLAKGISQDVIVDAIKNSPEAKLQAMYQEVLGRAADADGLQFYMDQVSKGLSLDVIKTAMEGSDEAMRKLRGFAVGTNQVPYDMPAYIHKDERIIPAADNRELMRRLASPAENSTGLAAEIRALRTEVAGLKAAAERAALAGERTADHTGQLAEQFDDVTEGGNAMRADVVNIVQTKEVA